MEEQRFPYRPNISFYFLILTFSIASVFILSYMAWTNEVGLILNRIITFSVKGATIFYWCLAAGAAVFMFIGLYVLFLSLTTTREVILGELAISAPEKGVSRKIVTIEYKDILDISIMTVQKQPFLHILYPKGKLSIPQNMLPSKKVFEELIIALNERVAVYQNG